MLKNRKKRVGRVISNKMEKTAIVVVETRRPHRLYKRIIKQMSKFMAHDENNECQIGDKVQIMEHRPISKEKRWIVTDIISRKEVVEVLETKIETPKAKPEKVEVKAKADTEAVAPEAEVESEVVAEADTEAVEPEAEVEVKAETEEESEDKS
jgi:small subunit ribosomal protein S17